LAQQGALRQEVFFYLLFLAVVFLLGRYFLKWFAPHSLMFCQQQKPEP
jgi:hypothetical protein